MPNGAEMMVTLLIVVVLFGGKKIPELARGLGKGIRDFNEAKDGIRNEIANGSALSSNADAQTAENTTPKG